MPAELDARRGGRHLLQLGEDQPARRRRVVPVRRRRVADLGVPLGVARDLVDQRPRLSPPPAAWPSASRCSRSAATSGTGAASSNRIFTLLSNPFLARQRRSWTARDARRGCRVDEDHDFRFAFGGRNGALTADNRRPAQSAFTLDMRVVTLPGYGAARRRPRLRRRTARQRPARRRRLGGWRRRGVHDPHAQHAVRLVEEAGPARRSRPAERVRPWLGGGTAWDIWQKKPIVSYDGNDLGMTDKMLSTGTADPLRGQVFVGPPARPDLQPDSL